MFVYTFIGLVLPERAQISLESDFNFCFKDKDSFSAVRISVILNQVTAWVKTEFEWEVHDLRNVIKSMIQHELEIIGFVRGYSYDLEITRVFNLDLGVDYVYGIDIPCLTERNKDVEVNARRETIKRKGNGVDGVLLRRCFSDLSNAMKYADDTGFYCYRAIESLRHHCSSIFGIKFKSKDIQWAKFREVSKCSKEDIMIVKKFSDPTRHGDVIEITFDMRRHMFMTTWDVVDRYIDNI